MNNIGTLLQFNSFGESHGSGIGGVLSGFPAGVKIDLDFIESEVKRRKPTTKFSTPRKENDSFNIISGVFEGISTGTPIGFFVPNMNAKSMDYGEIKNIFRPSHADFTYFKKYGIRDYRGGGRASARESVSRVIAGALSKLILNEFNIKIYSAVFGVGNIISELNFLYEDSKIKTNIHEELFTNALLSEINAIDQELEEAQKSEILKAKKEGDSIGASIVLIIKNVPIGLGEPLYYKLDSMLAGELMGFNAVKAIEFGLGKKSAELKGSENNDFLDSNGFKSNNSGGVLGGISNGEDILIRIYFKPTPSIFLPQNTVNLENEEQLIKLNGRHDPCVGVRAGVVCESICALIIADMLMINATRNIFTLKNAYKKNRI